MHQVQNHLDQFVFFRRLAGRYHQCNTGESIVVDAFASVLAQKNFVLVQKTDKHCGGDALVAVHEAVVFGDKIKKMSGFLFQCRIEVFAVERLIDCATSPTANFTKSIRSTSFLSSLDHFMSGIMVIWTISDCTTSHRHQPSF